MTTSLFDKVPSAALVRYQQLYGRKKRLFQYLYEFTKNQCGACVESGCACKDKICQHVEEQAQKRGIKFMRTGHALRFIGEQGCIVPPYLRETCTIYLCGPAQSKPGFHQKRYEQIKRLCDRVEWQLMEIEESHKSLKSFSPL